MGHAWVLELPRRNATVVQEVQAFEGLDEAALLAPELVIKIRRVPVHTTTTAAGCVEIRAARDLLEDHWSGLFERRGVLALAAEFESASEQIVIITVVIFLLIRIQSIVLAQPCQFALRVEHKAHKFVLTRVTVQVQELASALTAQGRARGRTSSREHRLLVPQIDPLV